MITSLQNPLVKHLVKLREDRKYREEQGSVLVSGLTLVKEIATHLPAIKMIVEVTRSSSNPLPNCQEYIEVSHNVLKKITGLPSPEPIAAEFPLPPSSNLTDLYPILALDAIRDPGNLGTLIRTALACGWRGLFLLPTCVDLFHEKVIRSSRGAAFRIPWKIGNWDELALLKKEGTLRAYTADLDGKELSTITSHPKTVLIMSNESQGVSSQGALFGEKITISMKGPMESLNVAVAGAILMYTLYK